MGDAQKNRVVGRARPDVPARGPSPPGDNQRTQRRSNSRTPQSPRPHYQLRTPEFGAGVQHSRGPEVADSPAGPESRTRSQLVPSPVPMGLQTRAPGSRACASEPHLSVHPLHCPGTGDARLPPPRVPSRPRAPEAALRLRVRGAGAPGEAAPGGAPASASAPVTPVVGPPRPGPGRAPPPCTRASRAPTTRAAPRTSPAGSRGEVTAPETPPPRPGLQFRTRHTPQMTASDWLLWGGAGPKRPGAALPGARLVPGGPGIHW